MRVLYMGTPDFAVPSLEVLVKEGFDVCAVITQPDRPSGRGMKLTAPAVKQYALAQNIPVYQPTKLRDDALLPLLNELSPDVIVVVAYGRILPKYILDFPRLGCINVHGSLLPKYRGAAPIQWAVLNGDKKSGVCTMYLNEGLDTGDIILSVETPIGEEETSENLFERLSYLGADTLVDTLRSIENGTATRAAQDETQATYARMLTKEDAVINWSRCDYEILNLIRGSYSWPIAMTTYGNLRLKVYRAIKGKDTTEAAGSVVCVDDTGMHVATGNEKTICITLFQLEGGKRMTPIEYFRGHQSMIGTVLGI